MYTHNQKKNIIKRPQTYEVDASSGDQLEEDIRLGYKKVSQIKPINPLSTIPLPLQNNFMDAKTYLKLMRDRGLVSVDESQWDTSKLPLGYNIDTKGIKHQTNQNIEIMNYGKQNSKSIINQSNESKKIQGQKLKNNQLYMINKIKNVEERGSKISSYLFQLQTQLKNQNIEQSLKAAYNLLNGPYIQSDLQKASVFNFFAKIKLKNQHKIWEGYMDLQRAKAWSRQAKIDKILSNKLQRGNQDQAFLDTQADQIMKSISQTQLNYNARFLEHKQIFNLLYPNFLIFRNRNIIQISSGDHHSIILSGKPIVQFSQQKIQQQFQTEVFCYGENSVGQVSGISPSVFDNQPIYFEQPLLIKQLSGKSIVGVHAKRQSSLAWDSKGNIFQWGVKNIQQKRGIQKTFQIHQYILKLEKGLEHYVALTNTKKLYIWGKIFDQNKKIIFQQKNPKQFQIQCNKIIDFSTGNSHILVVMANGKIYGIGSNHQNQLGLSTQKKAIQKKIQLIAGWDQNIPIKKIFCIQDCTFLLTDDDQLYYCGRVSQKKSTNSINVFNQIDYCSQQSFLTSVICINGYPGHFSMIDNYQNKYTWDVDNSLRFRKEKMEIQLCRVIQISKTQQLRLASGLFNKINFQLLHEDKKINVDNSARFRVSFQDKWGKYFLRQDLNEQNLPFIMIQAYLTRADSVKSYKELKNIEKGNERRLKKKIEGGLLYLDLSESFSEAPKQNMNFKIYIMCKLKRQGKQQEVLDWSQVDIQIMGNSNDENQQQEFL